MCRHNFCLLVMTALIKGSAKLDSLISRFLSVCLTKVKAWTYDYIHLLSLWSIKLVNPALYNYA